MLDEILEFDRSAAEWALREADPAPREAYRRQIMGDLPADQRR